jgi:hypothetical protein
MAEAVPAIARSSARQQTQTDGSIGRWRHTQPAPFARGQLPTLAQPNSRVMNDPHHGGSKWLDLNCLTQR